MVQKKEKEILTREAGDPPVPTLSEPVSWMMSPGA